MPSSVVAAAMAGTNARALRRPRVFRGCSGAVPIPHVPRSMDQVLNTAKQYAKAPILGADAVDFKLEFEACEHIDVRLRHTCASPDHASFTLAVSYAQADECGVSLASSGFAEADEARGWDL